MEPVPETERMEEFKKSPAPLLRLKDSSLHTAQLLESNIKNPPVTRRCTEPTPHSPRSPLSLPGIPFRPRNTSPFSRGHMRSKSSTGGLAPPPMSRAQSLPGISSTVLSSAKQRPPSPRGSPSRIRTPRKPVDEIFIGLPNRNFGGINETGETGDTLPEEDELTPRATERCISPLGLSYSASSLRLRRPASPLRYLSQQNIANCTTPTPPSSAASSPFLHMSRFNDSVLGTYSFSGSYSSSSIPSTPTSARSRSPSISSLETIPDSPDAEEAALEAERIAQLKAAADAADCGDEIKAKYPADGSGPRGRLLGAGFGRDKRKRWSVCGAERRGDLNLDTIWED